MAYSFGDGFDCYAAPADAINGYWDSGPNVVNFPLVTGRFAGSRAIQGNTSSAVGFIKSSGANDAVHHLVAAIEWTNTLSGTNEQTYLQLLDGSTAQCTIICRSDGVILLQSGVAGGTTLATYTGAATLINTWYAFEFEVVINNTTGSFTVRKNGNTSNNFTATGLNTRGGTSNNYANRLQIGTGGSGGGQQALDDLYWRSDASSVAWLGDIRCYTRMPASDSSVTFSRVPATLTQTPFVTNTVSTIISTWSFYTPITASYSGTVGTVVVSINAGFTGNLKCSVFNGTSSGPTTILASATTLTNPTTGSNSFTFSSPFTIARGTLYWIGFAADGSYTNALNVNNSSNPGKLSTTVAYASFPTASPTVSADAAVICSWIITLSLNCQVVSEAQQDTTTSYVYDSTVNDTDFYTVATIPSQPSSVIAVTTRAYMQKSDAGSRTAAVQLKSGATTVASPTVTLTTSGWQWAWRTDATDPNTSSAWVPANVDNVTIGPKIIS